MKTQVLPITPESVALAARLLQQGELVALPTETVYGIAADARNGVRGARARQKAGCRLLARPADDGHAPRPRGQRRDLRGP